MRGGSRGRGGMPVHPVADGRVRMGNLPCQRPNQGTHAKPRRQVVKTGLRGFAAVRR
ncbi:hypothetical protein RAA17_04625 [Komagataeibacter rhaeticus]|nr:hypothetical protein [Komagataeibacter rhaeticus]